MTYQNGFIYRKYDTHDLYYKRFYFLKENDDGISTFFLNIEIKTEEFRHVVTKACVQPSGSPSHFVAIKYASTFIIGIL